MTLTALGLSGEPFHGPATASATQRHHAPSELRHSERLTTAARPAVCPTQNRSVCRVMVCPRFGQGYRSCMHIARQLGHDVAMPRRGTASTKNLSQRPMEASSRPVTPDRMKVGLEVSPVDAVTLSDVEGRENARGAAGLLGSGEPATPTRARADGSIWAAPWAVPGAGEQTVLVQTSYGCPTYGSLSCSQHLPRRWHSR
jgi:hypothetical protein